MVGILLGLMVAVTAAIVLDDDLGAGGLLLAVVALTPALAGFGAVLAVSAAAALGGSRHGRALPYLSAEVEQAARQRLGAATHSLKTVGGPGLDGVMPGCEG
jgi:hypothetical protein